MGWILKPGKPGVPMDRRRARRLLWRARLLPWLAAIFPLVGVIHAVTHHTPAMIGVFIGQMVMFPVVIGISTRPSIATLKRMADEDSKSGKD